MISLIAALDRNNAIGLDNKLPWHLPNDLKHFKALTTGKTILMGRKTYQSIGKPLPNRTNWVLSRDLNFKPDGVQVFSSIEALPAVGQLYVIGGGDLYAQFLPQADRLHLTLVDTTLERADAFFPAFDPDDWLIASQQEHPADEKHPFAFKMIDFVRFG